MALGCAIYVLIAALIAHRNFGDGNQMSHFWKNIAIVGGFFTNGRLVLDPTRWTPPDVNVAPDLGDLS